MNSQNESSLMHELGFGCSDSEIGKVTWISLAYLSVTRCHLIALSTELNLVSMWEG